MEAVCCVGKLHGWVPRAQPGWNVRRRLDTCQAVRDLMSETGGAQVGQIVAMISESISQRLEAFVRGIAADSADAVAFGTHRQPA